MGSSPDRSRFVDGFQRTLYAQSFSAAGTIDLARVDTLVTFAIPAGTFTLTLDTPLFDGQLVVLQATTDAGGTVVVDSPFLELGSSFAATATFGTAQASITLMGVSTGGSLSPFAMWTVLNNDNVVLA